jgi:(1->4)-alpha-D-glucan 1-alpha-D-glucosylmutase
VPPLRQPVSTYRLQLNRDFTFTDARRILPYLTTLGITDCYTSPFLQSSPGSMHGYDICNHSALNPELGAETDFDRFCDELKRHHLGLILDFVPNHMGLDIQTNEWWRDVLENGPSSAYAEFFDIDWDPVKPELKGKILLPILGDQYGAVLERGELRVGFDAGALHLQYYDRRLPLDPRQSPRVFRIGLEALQQELTEDDAALREFLSILTALENLPPTRERDPARCADRRREKTVAAERLLRLVEQCERIRRHIEAAVTRVNGVPHERHTFDCLHELLEAQAYRLAHWRTAVDEINYRRFFDVNELGGLRMEDPRVFQATHGLILRLIGERKLSGLRIDHADGLFDPSRYFHDLQRAAAAALGEEAGYEEGQRPLYVVAEKILGADEHLRSDWAIEGTTGYGFLNDVNGLFVDTANAGRLRNIYAHYTARGEDFAEVAYRAKRLITTSSMASELTVLAQALNRISESDRRTRDFTLNALRKALVEVVACFPIYRTYVSDAGYSAADRGAIDYATDRARQRNPVLESSIFLFLRNVLLTDAEGSGDQPAEEEIQRRQRRTFAMKFQQYSSPVQAKGVEDTAYYRYNPLISLNEVGGDPRRFGRTIEEFHAGNRTRLESYPHELITTATHDTKRGEDTRARINVISEMPKEWRQAVACWKRTNAVHRTAVDRESAPDRNDEYLFYQSLVGVWPAEPPNTPIPPEAPPMLVGRMREFMQKAIKEAKVHTSWINVNLAYESAVSTFVETTLSGPGARPFLSSFVPFARLVAARGMVNSLAQLVLKLASPGVADFFQGTECWDLSLVDPDNRRQVDFARREAMLEELLPWIRHVEREPREATADDRMPGRLEDCVATLLEHWHDGRIKLFVAAVGLRLRSRAARLMARGDYTPLAFEGPAAAHLVGFSRCMDGKALLAIVPRLTSSLSAGDARLPIGEIWDRTRIMLPPTLTGRSFHNVITGARVPACEREAAAEGLDAAEAFRTVPVALLWSDRPAQ